MSKKALAILVLSMICSSSVFAANLIRRGNLIIDLDTGKITIASDATGYTSLLDNSTGTIVTGAITISATGSISQPVSATGTIASGVVTTGNTISASTGATVIQTGSVIVKNELEKAIQRGYDHTLTIYDTPLTFKADNAITRQEAAKFLFQASVLLGNNEIQSGVNCTFSDANQVHPGLQSAVTQSCTIGLMKGGQGLFRPLNNLSRAEALTIISRIAGYTDSPTATLRRSPYYKFVKNLGILNTQRDESTMDYKISRGDLMLLLYRLYQKQGNNTIDSNQILIITKDPIATNPTVSPSAVSLGAGISDDPEFITALLWMNKAGMTRFWRASDYNPLATLTRGQAAQFLTVYDQKYDTHNTSYSGCAFTDIATNNFKSSIQYTCDKGIFRGGNKLFRPEEAIIKAEFIAGILNMLAQYPSQTTGNWSNDVFKKALSLELITRADESTFNKPITRYEVALILSKLHLKNEFTKSLSDSTISYNIISPIDNNQTVSISGQQKVVIDINSIDSREFTNGFITLFGTNYKINKKQVTQYFPTSYVRYGEITDVSDDSVIGMISMSIGQKGIGKSLIEGYIIIDSESGYYTIQGAEQAPYYLINKVR